MQNPFEQIEARLSNIEALLLDIKHQPKEQASSTQQENEELLTVEEAATFLRLSIPTIYGMISKGKIPVMKRSKRCYFSKVELLQYLKAGRKKTLDEIASAANDYIKNKKG